MSKYFSQTWFVTGATGLVGSTIIETIRDSDISVIALARETSPNHMIDYLENLDVKIVYGDINNPSSYKSYLAACDVICHTAAVVQQDDDEKNWKVNTEGTKQLIHAMIDLNIKRLIHISTAGIYARTGTNKITEEHPVDPIGSYTKSKLAAEEVIKQFKDILNITILRLPFIFGEYKQDRHVIPTLIEKIPQIVPKIWNNNPEIGFCHAKDVARFVLLVGVRENTPSLIYNIQSFAISYTSLINRISDAQDRKIYIVPIPYFVLFVGSYVFDIIGKIFGKSNGLTKKLRLITKDWKLSIQKARHELGWKPVHHDPDELLRLMVEYIHNRKFSRSPDIRELIKT